MDLYQNFIYTSRYARWLPEENRREVFEETVDRYINFFRGKLGNVIDDLTAQKVKKAIMNLEVMPSMRAFMTAGKALERDNIAGYNCSFLAIEGDSKKINVQHEEFDGDIEIRLSKPVDFDEVMYVLLCGTGVGFSVERQFVNQLPKVGKKLSRRICTRNNTNYPGVAKEELSYTDKKSNTIVVADSKYGWASALRNLVVELYNGNFDISWDVSLVRPAGSRLNTFGGRSSGPEPLVELFDFTVNMFKKADGRKLTSIECHDLVCKIASIVVVGGVRRSALISLSNLSDERMRHAKSGAWWQDEGQRALANNSACYTENPDIGTFMREWTALYDSKSGERGIFNREASKKKAAENGRRNPNYEFGTNPCSEIILRSGQLCNLTEIVVRPDDNVGSLMRKAEIATILGTWQSTLTDFVYLSERWKKNCDEERLLGVSMTGIMDNTITSNKHTGHSLSSTLNMLKNKCIAVNKEWADKLGINQSTAITCVKPSGTVSQLVDSASGIHSRHNPYYIRTVRGDKKDPLTQFMIDSGVPHEDCVMNPANTTVFSFPMKSPDSAICRTDVDAIKQLDLWLIYQKYWCEHKPSVTISVKEHEWMEVGAWVYENFDEVSGVSFLPYSDHSYQQAPYQDIEEEEYNKLNKTMPKSIDWSELSNYETVDTTKGTQELACSAGVCEIVEI